MTFSFEQVVSLLAMGAALVAVAWALVGYINGERDKLRGEIEHARERIHALANRTQAKMDDFATKEDLALLERLLLARHGPHDGDE